MPDRACEAARLLDQATELGVDLEPPQAEALLEFRDLVRKWNRAFNLVSRQDVPRLVPRHLLDSLTVVPWLEGSQVLDVGTGAGFPGIPLAIARQDAQFTLVDTSERKIRFIRQTARTLKLDNVASHCADVRALDPAWEFDTVVSRAVADPAGLWALAGDRLRAGGRMVVMSRTGMPLGQAALDVEPPLPEDARLEDRRNVQVPGLADAHELLLLRHRSCGGAGAGNAA